MKSISVWLATYNGETFLRQQLDGVARQTHLPAELVASDDGSTDGTIGILEDFASSAPFPVHIHHNTTSQGYRFDFMHGLTFCRSDLIALRDQDDLWDPSKLLVTRKEFEDHPDALLFFHNAWLACSENNRLKALDTYQMAPRNPPLTVHNLFNPHGFSMVFDRRLMRFSGLLPCSISIASPGLLLAHDAWVFFLSAISGTIVDSDLELVDYRQHSSNVVGAPDRGLAAKLRHRFRLLVNHGGRYRAQAHAIHLRARILADSADRLTGLWRERALAGELKWPTVLRPTSRTGKALPRRWCVRARIVTKLCRSGAYPPDGGFGRGREVLAKDVIIGILLRRFLVPPAPSGSVTA